MHKRHLSPDACTACTTCMAYCPVTRVTGKFRGPKMTGPAFERFRLLTDLEDDSLGYCSNCKNCDIACPSGVPISTLNMLARAEYCKNSKPPLGDWFVSHGEKIALYTSFIPSFIRNMGMNNFFTRIILDYLGIHRKAPLPPFASETFIKRFRRMRFDGLTDKRVVFFPGCFINVYNPQIGIDLAELLRMAGYGVIVPKDFVCCGLPLVSNGFADEAERYAVQNSKELAKWAERGTPVLTACPSCALTLKREYGELFPAAESIGAGGRIVSDACEFLLGLLDGGELKPTFRSGGESVIYHAPCHLRAQGIGKTGLELTRRISGVSASDADAGCCGLSGSYGLKKSKYDIAMDIGGELFDAINHSAAGMAVTECGSCQMQIARGTGRTVINPISLFRKHIET